ncbi:hypothetical protein GF374_02995 [Candidatus Woesearchaeota archaeon]|nr:hypothetical protein [Candidatus Woesearchaeota archaeon]
MYEECEPDAIYNCPKADKDDCPIMDEVNELSSYLAKVEVKKPLYISFSGVNNIGKIHCNIRHYATKPVCKFLEKLNTELTTSQKMILLKGKKQTTLKDYL